MKRAFLSSLGLSALSLCCLLSAACVQRTAKIVNVPPPPKAAPPPSAPLVFPQNVAKAPPSQPVPPEAIPVLPAGGLAIASEPEMAVPPRPAPRAAAPLSQPRIAETPVPASQEPAPAAPLRQPTILQNRNDQTRNQAVIAARIRQTRTAIAQLARRNLVGQLKDDRDRSASMLDLAQQALNRGDLRQADDLSDRAAILANIVLNAQ